MACKRGKYFNDILLSKFINTFIHFQTFIITKNKCSIYSPVKIWYIMVYYILGLGKVFDMIEDAYNELIYSLRNFTNNTNINDEEDTKRRKRY